MVALTVTAAQVQAASPGNIRSGIAAAAITEGQSVYRDATADTWNLADADAVATVPANDIGICVGGAAGAGARISIQVTGSPVLGAGAAPVVGTMYFVGTTAGSIVPEGDLGSGDFPCLLGAGSATNALLMRVWSTEEAKA